ncbi:MAG TPA: GTP 3',8-cyclase MoaA [Candidatus Desulfofervidus auxilii]|uniref:GTP 3',8-cyclase n=1 Tax=Desulfofervidus auxilii TaxID=1621989 RepID=A0A7V1I5L9_DESA2|nr:GTP 3',8-cyclase MoaA [Candidatus Desulfofervidus auxilii]
MSLRDAYNREITYLRISVTDRCNLRCRYCIPRKALKRLPHHEILTYEEIVHLVKIAAQMGFRKIRLTGGEPLMRQNIVYLIEQIGNISTIQKLCLTTNGTLLREFALDLYRAGLRHINISLDTLSPPKYAYITGVDAFSQTWAGIKKAMEIGFHPIKINVVLIKGVNDNEIIDLANLSFDYPLYIRFIEFMPLMPTSINFEQAFISIDEVKERLKKIGKLEEVPSGELDGPAQRYKFRDSLGEVGFISALSHHFCHKCNRLRLTSDGQLRPCLFSDQEWDLKTPLRQGAPNATLKAIIENAISYKPKNHGYIKFVTHRPMFKIGG